MMFPRLAAAIFVVVLIGMLAAACVGGLMLFGPMLTHGNNVEHAAGKIVAVGPGKDFVLKTATGMLLHFQCSSSCHASLPHMQRHLHEDAHTDVYYVAGAKHTLLAVNVD
jgi:hypothetical protein